MYLTVIVLEVRQQNGATGAEVLVGVRFLYGVVHVEVVSHGKAARSGKLDEPVPIRAWDDISESAVSDS
jgi:hypothetical protein